jgi:hypothetical protein
MQRNHRHLGETEQAGSCEAPVTRDHVAVVACQYWIDEAKRPDAAGDLGDLRIAMRSRIARGRD